MHYLLRLQNFLVKTLLRFISVRAPSPPFIRAPSPFHQCVRAFSAVLLQFDVYDFTPSFIPLSFSTVRLAFAPSFQRFCFQEPILTHFAVRAKPEGEPNSSVRLILTVNMEQQLGLVCVRVLGRGNVNVTDWRRVVQRKVERRGLGDPPLDEVIEKLNSEKAKADDADIEEIDQNDKTKFLCHLNIAIRDYKDLQMEEDASLECHILTAVKWILDNTTLLCQVHRTSLFVKFFANLHYFVLNICEEQKSFFVLKVMECLQMDLSNLLPGFSFASDAPKVAIASKNLRNNHS
ncbi:hypothetical protein V8G54_001985 [Vigna mungo]|uniref:Nodulin homeobox N-terminal domain-containing protein n=1 Tax=Vigna mungo TaxID=3915 RepID=A0AAQ3P7A0_VIGMU